MCCGHTSHALYTHVHKPALASLALNRGCRTTRSSDVPSKVNYFCIYVYFKRIDLAGKYSFCVFILQTTRHRAAEGGTEVHWTIFLLLLYASIARNFSSIADEKGIFDLLCYRKDLTRTYAKVFFLCDSNPVYLICMI